MFLLQVRNRQVVLRVAQRGRGNMKKILIGMICDGKAGGIDKYLLNFYDSVKSEGLRIDFLTNKKDAGLEKALKESGSNLYEVASLIHPVRQYRDVKRLVEENGYDVLYMNISTALAFPALKAAHDCGVEKVVLHSHSSGYDCENAVKRWLFTCLHFLCKPLVSKYANRFYTCSEKAAEWMFTRGINRRKGYRIILNAVDTAAFVFSQEKRRHFREKLDIDDKFVIGNVGNLCYQKNPLFLIAVFREVLKKEPNAHLVMIGDGVLMPKLKKRIDKYHLADKVSLLGRVDVSQGYMNAFDVFALPSNFEGLGIVYIEAQYTRVPCVASDRVPSLARICNMMCFVPLDVRKWAEQILQYREVDKDAFVFTSGDGFVLSQQKQELFSILDIEKGVEG